MVHKYPHEVTIYEGGPMTNLALAISLDPEFAEPGQRVGVHGRQPESADGRPEFANTPRREFNLWFDPEAAHIVLRTPWKKIVCTPVDISVKTRMTNELIDKVKAGNSPAAQYIGKYSHLRGSYNYLWDELAAVAWLDPASLRRKKSATWTWIWIAAQATEIPSPGQIRISPTAMCSRWKCSST